MSAFVLPNNGKQLSRCSIEILEISEEITYFQSRVFSKFITDLLDKLHNKGSELDACQRDILQLILSQFHSKFTQRHFPLQQIIHINDLKLMADPKSPTCAFHKMFEIQYPFNYIEYLPTSKLKTRHMQQIGSLSRISAYINACQRVRYAQTLSRIDTNRSVTYLDGRTLILKNQQIARSWTTEKTQNLIASGSGTHQYYQKSMKGFQEQFQDIGLWGLRYETTE